MMIEDPIPALKVRLHKLILEEIGDENMWMAGRILGLDQPSISRLSRGCLERFSVDRLIRLLARINRKVEVNITVTGPLPTRWHERVWELKNKSVEKPK